LVDATNDERGMTKSVKKKENGGLDPLTSCGGGPILRHTENASVSKPIETTELREANLNTQTQPPQSVMTRPSTNANVKIIKRYQNRKLYDTQQSCYVTLEDIAKMIRANEEVMVIDNKTKRDITAATLTQIIFEAEKKASEYAPLSTLREIIQHANGSISSFLAKLGAFPANAVRSSAEPRVADFIETQRSYDDVKSNIEQRLSSARSETSENGIDVDDTPELPGANKALSS
jgi:polyhydroxyalkanoate synthesis repressor PhaR